MIMFGDVLLGVCVALGIVLCVLVWWEKSRRTFEAKMRVWEDHEKRVAGIRAIRLKALMEADDLYGGG